MRRSRTVVAVDQTYHIAGRGLYTGVDSIVYPAGRAPQQAYGRKFAGKVTTHAFIIVAVDQNMLYVAESLRGHPGKISAKKSSAVAAGNSHYRNFHIAVPSTAAAVRI